MKTSELIRAAVDTHLWDGIIDRDSLESDGGKIPYLCCVLSTYSGDNPQAQVVATMIQEELEQYRKENPSGVCDDRRWPIGSTLNWQWVGAELQAFRFMYAEMLACYFESIGD